MSIVRKSDHGARGESDNQHHTSPTDRRYGSGGLQTPTSGSLVGGRYRLIRLLGRGAMGTVYQAEDQLHRRCCAVKMLNNAGSCGADELRRFHNEATAISRLSHPNIVQMYDSLEDSYGRSYLVMELLDGVDLFAYLQAEGRLTLRRTQAIVAPVAAALYSAHRLGIIHRESMNDQRSTGERPSPIQSVIRAVRSVIRAEVRMRVEGTGDISSVERAHTRLENAVR